jgi:LuxR family transcriptional regulator, maltose regulon positive regulatory protein
MSQSVVNRPDVHVLPARVGVPAAPGWAVPRRALASRLEVGISGQLTVVAAPTGAGKSLGVASWAACSDSSVRMIWLNLARGGSDPDRVWRHLRESLAGEGVPDLPGIPPYRGSGTRRNAALADLGVALRERGPWVAVLDGYPAGRPGRLGTELGIVLEHARRGLRLVVLSQAEPALNLHRTAAAGELTRVDAAELVMDDAEIEELLRREGVDHDDETTAAVSEHTAGWACGVRLAAVALRGARDLRTAMVDTDRAVADYLTHEVLDTMSSSARELIIWTSLVKGVAPGLAKAVLPKGADSAFDQTIAATGLIQQGSDDSYRCHPLLRSAARAQLASHPPDLTRNEPRKLLVWYLDHGDSRAAIELAVAARDWNRAAELLVQSHAVPRLVGRAASETVQLASRLPDVQEAEPLLRAAIALVDGDARAAEVALGRAAAGETRSDAHQLALAIARLGVARLSGQSLPDEEYGDKARALVAQLRLSEHDAKSELSLILDATTAAVDAARGEHDRAALSLAHGADAAGTRRLGGWSDCVGQLALVEAYRGDLRSATFHAAQVLAVSNEDVWAGVAQAHTAMAWVQVDRGAPDEARRSLDDAGVMARGRLEPWLSLAMETAEARLLVAAGRPEAALARTASATAAVERAGLTSWLVGFLTTISAEALLAAGEPQRALAMLTAPQTDAAHVERTVLTAAARRDIGDARGASAVLASVVEEVPLAPLSVQIDAWLLEMRLAHDQGHVDRARLLADRALRAASAQELRRPFAHECSWLRWFLHRETALLRIHRSFVASLLPARSALPTARHGVPTARTMVLEPLTERETQVLELLAQMCSTEEIADELFVSANTVKTHMKGVFRKLCVNRRGDAVRQGRELGLC